MSKRAVTIAILALALPASVRAQSGGAGNPPGTGDPPPAERRDLVDPRTGQFRETEPDDSARPRSPYGTPYRITTPWQDHPLRTPWH